MSVKIGLVGTGTIGSGVLDVYNMHREDYAHYYDIDIEIARISALEDDAAKRSGMGDRYTPDYHDVVNDPDIDIVIELIGGTRIARTVVTEALQSGKHVVTANKALLAAYGAELEQLAADNGVELMYEASVGGAIPIIDPLRHSLAASRIDSILGIVNGTTNYVLTRMSESGLTYDEALAEAQAKGFAEANPTADVDGFDAAAKTAILASLAFHTRVTQDQVPTEGIRAITPLDLQMAADMGYCVKLLAIARRHKNGIEVGVHPAMLPLSHQLSSVRGEFNAIYVTGDAVGETMYFGKGAGSHPTASAVMGDVLQIARHIRDGVPAPKAKVEDEANLVPLEELQDSFYIRMECYDRPGVLAKTAEVFASNNVSIRQMIQKGHTDHGSVNLVYITHTASEKAVRESIEGVRNLDAVIADDQVPVVLRVVEK